MVRNQSGDQWLKLDAECEVVRAEKTQANLRIDTMDDACPREKSARDSSPSLTVGRVKSPH